MPIRCPVCGAAHATCGGPWAGQPVDGILEVKNLEEGPTQRYRDAAGHIWSLTPARAKLLGYTPVSAPLGAEPAVEPGPEPKPGIVDGKALAGPPENKAIRGSATKRDS